MLKWLLTLAITVVIAALFLPRLVAWLGLFRLPGDITLRWGKRTYVLPFATTLLLSLLAILIGRLL